MALSNAERQARFRERRAQERTSLGSDEILKRLAVLRRELDRKCEKADQLDDDEIPPPFNPGECELVSDLLAIINWIADELDKIMYVEPVKATVALRNERANEKAAALRNEAVAAP